MYLFSSYRLMVAGYGYISWILGLISENDAGGGEVSAAGSLAIGFANITGYSILKELAIRMEPIC